MIPIKTASAWRGVADCMDCGVRDSALFADLREEDFALIHAPIDDLEFAVGDHLLNAGTPSNGVMTLRSGFVKLARVTSDGRERIVRVLRRGAIVGLEALAGSPYENDAIALTPVAVCRIPTAVILRLDQHTPRLHQRLMKKWQESVSAADDWLTELNFGSAHHRVTQLILRMRGETDPQVTTLFSRDDMGSMLGLTLETVSRVVNEYVRKGWLASLDAHGRSYRVQVLDAAALQGVE